MPKPFQEVAPSELFLKLLERPAPNEVYPFPRMGDDGEPVFNVRVFVLAEKTLEVCRLRARKWLLEKAKESAAATQLLDEHTIGDRLVKECIAEAVHEDRVISGTDDWATPRYRRLFRGADDVGELTADEVAALYGAYLMTQLKFGPTDATFTDEREVNEWVGRLSDGARPFALPLLQSHQRDALLLSLVQRSSTLSKILLSPPESWQTSLESLRTSWKLDTVSSSSPAVESTPSSAEPERVITKEEAIAAARAMRKASRLE